MPPLELYSIWIAVVLYALSSVAAVAGFAFTSSRSAVTSVSLASFGLLPHALAVTARWIRVGHGPAIGFFEVASGLAFLGVLAFVVLAVRSPGLRVAGLVVMPVSLLVLGATLMANPEARVASGALASGWLIVHVLFANLAFACYVGASVLAVGQLVGNEDSPRRFAFWAAKMPVAEELDTWTFRLVGAGLLLQGVMIISGAIWANAAWGRYWGWDPMETWSLIAWVVYALYLHVALTLGWQGKRSAWLIVGALAVILFSLLGVPIAYDSVHGAYLRF